VTTLLNEPRSADDGDATSLDAAGRKEMLEVIDEEADRLDRFIEGLTRLARIEAGEMHLRRHWSSIDEIITTALKRAEPLTRHHRIAVAIEDELPAVRLDEHLVAEVVYTLVDNAAKYSPPGTSIRVGVSSNADETIKLTIGDQGPGIPPELHERVFDKFFRAMRDGDARGRPPRGSGMGLAIAKGIVEAHGGRIWIENGTDAGTTFVVALPTGDDDANEPIQGEVVANLK
jgi:two-component system sensor histidine kinase KdpD